MPDEVIVVKTPFQVSDEQGVQMRYVLRALFPSHQVLILDGGIDVMRMPSDERLSRIEGKLDALIDALIEDGETAPALTLDGAPEGGERDQSQPL